MAEQKKRTHAAREFAMVVAFVIIGGIAGALIAMRYGPSDAPEAVKAITSPEECIEEIKAITLPVDLVALGDSYFGGEKDYNTYCARFAYERATHIDPKGSFRAWYQLGRIDFIQGNLDAALFRLNKQVEYFGNTLPNVHYMLGLTYGYRARQNSNSEDWQYAEAAFRNYLELDPISPWARTDLGWVLFAQGKYEEMKPVLEEGLKKYPQHAWLLNMYGLALLNTGKTEEAADYFRRADTLATALTPEEWGKAYPGNDPALWPRGLKEMQDSIRENILLAETQSSNTQ
jgi:tetratricopeptide (TPR) repeat protein